MGIGNVYHHVAESVYHLVSDQPRLPPPATASSMPPWPPSPRRGYEATSLDTVAKSLELTKQSILYWFPSKDALLEAVIARSAADLSAALETALRGRGRAGSGSRRWCARSSAWPRASPSCSACCGRWGGWGRRRRRR